MTTKVDSNLFMDSSFGNSGKLYQLLVSKIADFQRLGTQLVRQAQAAQAVRQVDRLQELGTMLSSLPVPEYRLIGQYYLAWCMSRSGKDAHGLFEEVAEKSTTYRTMALIELGSYEARKGDLDSCIKYYKQALKYSEIPYTAVLASRSIAAIKGLEGFHMRAVKDLDRINALVRYCPVIEQCQYRNSLAVELGEVGRKEEARNIIQPVIESPLIIAYPEWQDTANELKQPDRSFISVPQSISYVEQKPVEIKTKPAPAKKEEKPGDVLPFKKLKEAPRPPKPDVIYQSQLEHMTADQKSQLLMSLILSKAIPNRHINKMLMAAGVVKRDSSAKEIDLEDLGLIADLMSEWCNMIDPGMFIGVMSAIRDCVNYTRQKNIIDNMISEAIRQTDDSIETEDEYRSKYERRLPEE